MNARFVVTWLAAAFSVLACDAGDVAVFSDAPSGGAEGGAAAGTAGKVSEGGTSESVGGATFSAGTSGMGESAEAGAGVVVCRHRDDCPATSFCLKHACGDAEGVCAPKPMVCFDTAPAPVCGCNHVVYWNDCLRQLYGIEASTKGYCGPGTHPCFMPSDCRGGESCSHLLGPTDSCGGPLQPGTCWVTPADCSSTGDNLRWAPCPPPGNSSSSGGPCVSTCEAIHIGHPFAPLAPGAPCP